MAVVELADVAGAFAKGLPCGRALAMGGILVVDEDVSGAFLEELCY